MTEMIVPDDVKSVSSSLFTSCSSLQEIRGHNIKYPSWLIEEVQWDELGEVPFSKKIPQIKSSFTYFAQEKIMKEIEAWQKKKEYETSAQWQARVTGKQG